MNITPAIQQEQQQEFIMQQIRIMMDDGSLPSVVTNALARQDRQWNARFAALEQQAQEAEQLVAARIDKYATKSKRHGEQIRAVQEQIETDRAQNRAAVAAERKKRKQDFKQLEEQSSRAIDSHTSAILDLQQREQISSAKNDKALAALSELQTILLQDRPPAAASSNAAAASNATASDDLSHLRIQ